MLLFIYVAETVQRIEVRTGGRKGHLNVGVFHWSVRLWLDRGLDIRLCLDDSSPAHLFLSCLHFIVPASPFCFALFSLPDKATEAAARYRVCLRRLFPSPVIPPALSHTTSTIIQFIPVYSYSIATAGRFSRWAWKHTLKTSNTPTPDAASADSCRLQQ